MSVSMRKMMRIKLEKFAVLLILALMQSASSSCRAENILGDVIKDVAGATSKVVKEVAKGAEVVVVDTGKVVKGTAKVGEVVVVDTAKGAGSLVKGTAKVGETVVIDTAKGAGSLVKGVARGASGLAEATGKAVAHVGDGKVPSDSANSVKGKSVSWSATSLLGTTCSVTVDGAGNIIDSSGHLVGRVVASQAAPESGSVSLAGQTFAVTIASTGEMRDGGGKVIGYLLGTDTLKSDTLQNAPAGKDEALKDSGLGSLHGFIPDNK